MDFNNRPLTHTLCLQSVCLQFRRQTLNSWILEFTVEIPAETAEESTAAQTLNLKTYFVFFGFFFVHFCRVRL